MIAHTAIHIWGAWSSLLFFLSGIAYGRVLLSGLSHPRGSWKELRELLTVLAPALAAIALLLSAIFEYWK